MPRKKKTVSSDQVGDYRHEEAQRKNNPPAGLAPTYEAREHQVKSYAYDPHLDPQLIWSEKPGLKARWEEVWEEGKTAFDVDVVSLNIHERASTRAILEAVRKPESQLALFGETPLPADQQIEFYQHEVGWANRLILGDSLLVMNSLLVKEGMAGKVQMVYVDPPYGIKYASNFQARLDRREVKDQDEDLTREPEQIKAYRDTWKLEIHSYLTYLRDRLLLARDLLHESGSIFVQINDENLHLVKNLLDEVFGRDNFVSVISFKKTLPLGSSGLAGICDYLLWFSKNKQFLKYRQLHLEKPIGQDTGYTWVELPDGLRRKMTTEERVEPENLPAEWNPFFASSLSSSGYTSTCMFDFDFENVSFKCGAKSWRTNSEGMRRLIEAERLIAPGKLPCYVTFHSDFPVQGLHNLWDDTHGATDLMFVVQTSNKVIERCILMTTDPGDLVLDPTCGSGTTAFCAERWGRRWITRDTSRVAFAIARQRLMTTRYDYYDLRDPERGPAGGFNYETVPHIMLESIAKNPEIDDIAKKYQPEIDEVLSDLNKSLGKRLKEWEVPREAEAGWAKKAKEAHERFWVAKREKRRKIDESIQRNAPQETLYDRPQVKRGVVRVSGPFTVEAIPVPVVEDPSKVPIPQYEEASEGRVNDKAGDYLTSMATLLRQQGGVLFPGGKKMELENLRPLILGLLHLEGESKQKGKSLRVAVSFGPQHGPVTAYQVQEATQTAKMNAYQALIFAGFSFDPESQAIIQRNPVTGLEIHFAHIAPDVLVGDLLKTGRASQIFTVFGQPDIELKPQKEGTYLVELKGVDLYDPITGKSEHARGEDVAAWFLDTDYDGMTFHITQAFFPGDADAWDKLQRALKAQIEPETFNQMRGTTSFPFQPGKHSRIAVKVVDFRGNEVVSVLSLGEAKYGKKKK